MANFHTFKDDAGRWRWHLTADNGKIVADSGQGYATLEGVRDAAQTVKNLAPGATID